MNKTATQIKTQLLTLEEPVRAAAKLTDAILEARERNPASYEQTPALTLAQGFSAMRTAKNLTTHLAIETLERAEDRKTQVDELVIRLSHAESDRDKTRAKYARIVMAALGIKCDCQTCGELKLIEGMLL